MIVVYLILSFALGLILGYGIFYFRFEDKNTINTLRENYKNLQSEYEQLKSDYDEYEAQNKILKDSIQKYKEKNEDLSNVVAELSRYVHALKVGGEKAKELSKILGIYDSEIEEKVKSFIHSEPDDELNYDSGEDDSQNKKGKIF